MASSTLILVLLGLAAAAYHFGRTRSLAVVGGPRAKRDLHSLPGYYGLLTALWCGLPALVIVGVWQLSNDALISHLVIERMPQQMQGLSESERSLLFNDVHNVI